MDVLKIRKIFEGVDGSRGVLRNSGAWIKFVITDTALQMKTHAKPQSPQRKLKFEIFVARQQFTPSSGDLQSPDD